MTTTQSMEFQQVSSPDMVSSNSGSFPKKDTARSPPRKGSKAKESKVKSDKSVIYRTDMHEQHIPMNIPVATMSGQPLPATPIHHIPPPRPTHHRSRDAPSNGAMSGLSKEAIEKKTRGRVRIRMEFISNKLRRYTTFSKRKTGIMKKAYELSTLTGTQVMLLVASETGHVYTFATPKLQPMITSETGKALIQTCLNSPDPPPPNRNPDERMSQTGYEETELAYPVTTEEAESKSQSERHLYTSADVNLNNSPTHSFGGLSMPHSSFSMNMGFMPTATTKHDSNNSLAGPGYTVQQQLGTFSTLFPPPTTYSNSMPPQNMANMSHNMTTAHMVRIPNSMSPAHSIDIGNMVTLQRNVTSTTPSTTADTTTYIYTSSPVPQEDSKQDIKQDSDSENRNDSSNSL